MRRIDGAVAVPNAPSRLRLAHIGGEFRRRPAPPRILRVEAGHVTVPAPFRRFAISHRTTHPGRKSRQDEAKSRCARAM
jgi:hypothetical protein